MQRGKGRALRTGRQQGAVFRNHFFKITGEERDSERHISLRSPSGEVEGWVHVEQVAAHAHALYSV